MAQMGSNPLDILLEGAKEIGRPLTEVQAKAFLVYLRELKIWGKKINLSRRTSEEEIILKDFLDSMTVAKYPGPSASLLDLGSGAGFPGIPLKIVREDLRVILLEATGKKVFFLKNLLRALGLKQIAAYWTGQKTDKPGGFDRSFDWVVSRAFGPIIRLVEAGMPYLNDGGVLLAMKGRKGEDELQENRQKLTRMGIEVAFIDRIRLPFLGHERLLIGLKNVRSTALLNGN